MNRRALVTLVLGQEYAAIWRQICQPNWQRYADKFHLDLICLDQPLDTSQRAQQRSPAWQKCLILSQPCVQYYEQVVWMDADILINHRRALNVFDDVPVEKVGAAEEFRFSGSPGCEMLDRMSEVWPHVRPMIQYTPREFYAAFGLPDDCDHAINTGVMVLSPLHQALLEKVYYQYEEKPGRAWHMEMRPLSYELNRAGLVRDIDPRFNVMWLCQKFLHYPFLLRPRLKHKLCGFDSACINVAFQRSYFFHLGGMYVADMRMIEA
jgi:hypothetical protein